MGNIKNVVATIIFLFSFAVSFGQIYQNNPVFGTRDVGGRVIKRFSGFPTGCGKPAKPIAQDSTEKVAAFFEDTCGHYVFVYDPSLNDWDTLLATNTITGSVTWGTIAGDINTQTDLITKFNTKVNNSDTAAMLSPYINDVSNLAPLFETSIDAQELLFNFISAPTRTFFGRGLGGSGDPTYISWDSLPGANLTFSSGLLRTGNNVVALNLEAIWNTNEFQDYPIQSGQPNNNDIFVFNLESHEWELRNLADIVTGGGGGGGGGSGVGSFLYIDTTLKRLGTVINDSTAILKSINIVGAGVTETDSTLEFIVDGIPEGNAYDYFVRDGTSIPVFAPVLNKLRLASLEDGSPSIGWGVGQTGLFWNGSSPTTVGLPDRGDAFDQVLYYKNAGSANMTIQRNGSDQIFDNELVTSFTLTPGQSVMLYAGATYWYTFAKSTSGGGSGGATLYTADSIIADANRIVDLAPNDSRLRFNMADDNSSWFQLYGDANKVLQFVSSDPSGATNVFIDWGYDEGGILQQTRFNATDGAYGKQEYIVNNNSDVAFGNFTKLAMYNDTVTANGEYFWLTVNGEGGVGVRGERYDDGSSSLVLHGTYVYTNASVQFGPGARWETAYNSTIDADFTITDLDYVFYEIAATVDRTITLPDATTNPGRELIISNLHSSGGNTIVTGVSGQGIGSGTTFTLLSDQTLGIISNGTDWTVLYYYPD